MRQRQCPSPCTRGSRGSFVLIYTMSFCVWTPEPRSALPRSLMLHFRMQRLLPSKSSVASSSGPFPRQCCLPHSGEWERRVSKNQPKDPGEVFWVCFTARRGIIRNGGGRGKAGSFAGQNVRADTQELPWPWHQQVPGVTDPLTRGDVSLWLRGYACIKTKKAPFCLHEAFLLLVTHYPLEEEEIWWGLCMRSWAWETGPPAGGLKTTGAH